MTLIEAEILCAMLPNHPRKPVAEGAGEAAADEPKAKRPGNCR